MKSEILNQLTEITKSEIARLGYNVSMQDYSDVPMYEWKAPPLIVEGSLFGIDCRDLMQVSISLNLEDFVLAYETFLYACAYEEQINLQEVCVLFKLNRHQGFSLFPSADITNLYNFVPALAALAYYNYEAEIRNIDYLSFSICVGRYAFGVTETEILNNEGLKIGRGPKPQFSRPHPNLGRRRYIPETELSKKFSKILKGLAVLGSPQEDLDAIQQAMTYIICDNSSEARGLWGLNDELNFTHPHIIDDALQMAREFRIYTEPLTFLKGLLCPRVLGTGNFVKFFGASKSTSDVRLNELDLRLDELTQITLKERELKC